MSKMHALVIHETVSLLTLRVNVIKECLEFDIQ